MRTDDTERTRGWVNGTPVTSRIDGSAGLVKWTRARRTDGKQFLRVRITSGPDKGKDQWEDGHWIIGQGVRLAQCADCLYPYRTNDPEASFCPVCARHHSPRYDPHAVTMNHAHLGLRSNAAPYARQPVTASAVAPMPIDPDEPPF
jgi:hypothetical protein